MPERTRTDDGCRHMLKLKCPYGITDSSMCPTWISEQAGCVVAYCGRTKLL